MITTIGKHIRVEAGKFRFCRDCESPGIVTLYVGSVAVDLPVDQQGVETFINAYRRAVAEDIEYRERKVE